MRLEDIEQEFPKMPEDIRMMIEKEVEKQVKTTPIHTQRRTKRTARRALIAALVAAMTLGTTVFAGVMYRMYSESLGKYGVETKMEASQEGGKTDAAQAIEISPVKMELGYLPQGMVETEEGKYSYEDNLSKGGISIILYRMDTGDSAFKMQDYNVLSSEDIKVNGHDGVYLKMQNLLDDVAFDQRIYVAYTDVHYLVQMYVASDVTKEEAIKIAEGITLTPVEEQEASVALDWSSYLESEEGNTYIEETAFTENNTRSADELNQHMHAIGESFSVENNDSDSYKGLMANVADVQVSDNVSILPESMVDEELKKETDSSGKLLPATINYIKNGDGVDSIAEIVSSEEKAQKLVYVTTEFTNTGESELLEVLFNNNLVIIQEHGGKMTIRNPYDGEVPKEGDAWNHAENTGLSRIQEMQYYDVRGGERGNNYVESIKPGETVTVHTAYVVLEENLDDMYLNLDNYGGCYEFSDTSLAMGYVDIRQ